MAKLTEEPEVDSDSSTAQPAGELTTDSGQPVGTVTHMSPEQALGQLLDSRTDVFSLGVVLYQMATGKLPFKGDNSVAVFNEILNKVPTSPIRLNPELPDQLETVLIKCLEKDRKIRYQTAIELMVDLKRLQKDLSEGPAASAQVSEESTEPRRNTSGQR